MMAVIVLLIGLLFIGCAVVFMENLMIKHRHSLGGCYKCVIDNKDVILILDWEKDGERYRVYNLTNQKYLVSGNLNVCESYLSAIGAVKINKNN